MWVEITEKAFNKLVTSDEPAQKVEPSEYFYKRYYNVCDGLTLLAIDNYLSCVTQYYIQDIKA